MFMDIITEKVKRKVFGFFDFTSVKWSIFGLWKTR